MTVNEEQATQILSNFGFKRYQSGKEVYFLQSKVKIKPMTKYSMKQMLELLNPKEEKSIIETVVKKVKPKTSKKVKKNE